MRLTISRAVSGTAEASGVCTGRKTGLAT
jgi:hypothetical protein